MKNRLDRVWISYVDAIDPRHELTETSVQYIETRRAFFAGARGLLTLQHPARMNWVRVEWIWL